MQRMSIRTKYGWQHIDIALYYTISPVCSMLRAEGTASSKKTASTSFRSLTGLRVDNGKCMAACLMQ